MNRSQALCPIHKSLVVVVYVAKYVIKPLQHLCFRLIVIVRIAVKMAVLHLQPWYLCLLQALLGKVKPKHLATAQILATPWLSIFAVIVAAHCLAPTVPNQSASILKQAPWMTLNGFNRNVMCGPVVASPLHLLGQRWPTLRLCLPLQWKTSRNCKA